MQMKFSQFLDRVSNYLAHRKGLLPILGLVLVAINAALQFVPVAGWLSQTDLLLHLGVILAILGFLVAWAL